MMNLKSAGGIVYAGAYDSLVLHGPHRLGSHVSFGKLSTDSLLRTKDCHGEVLACSSGRVICTGNLHVRLLSGYGSIMVHGDIECESLDFTGDIAVKGNIRTHSLKVSGMVSKPRCIDATSIDITGHIVACSVHTEQLTLSTLQSTLLHRHGMPHYAKRSVIDTVVAAQVNVHQLRCRSMDADSITLSDECLIEYVRYRDRLTSDISSAVIMRNHGTSPPHQGR
ncbi:hypothetical protein [Bifidobacterium tsurumiense]|uniref:hypothetical protein n=1 Tax=Bifidobacterium tsurumiense TaxID=356829 RepID=UPI0003FD7B1F|nr:hypothetical protein [Bifidobacterium tsurumiense]MDY4678102.1 hypothetical protein [Bifidobacterium tsurumiense]